MNALPSHFYAMVDPIAGHAPVDLARILLSAGARILQLRLKRASGRDFLSAARTIAELCREHRALFIVNDRADIAMLQPARTGFNWARTICLSNPRAAFSVRG